MRRNTRGVGQSRRGPGLMGTMARTAVVAGTATAVSRTTSAKMDAAAQAKQAQQQAQVQAMVDQQLAEQQAQMAAPAAAAPSDTDIRIARLKELAALRDAGILTEEEFQSEKARVLAS